MSKLGRLASLIYNPVLQPVEQWDVKDSSKMDTFMQCQRRYFFRYILGWVNDRPNIHLGFGSAWHLAVEYLCNLPKPLTKESVKVSSEIFETEYRKMFSADWDEENAPKNPAMAFTALTELAERLNRTKMKVLHTEVPGTIRLTENDVIHFKIDLIAEGEDGHEFAGQKFVIDWKTAQEDSQRWRDQWTNAIQPATYIHALNGLYGMENVAGVYMYGTAFRKKGIGWMEHHVGGTPEKMMSWMWTMRYWFQMLEWNHTELTKCAPEQDVMEAFPMNPHSCSGKYGLCPFISICSNASNPLQNCETPPPNYRVEHWDPRDREDDASTVLDGKELVKK